MSHAPKVNLTLGSPATIEEVAMKVGQALGITFKLHDSMYLGGDYYRSCSVDGEFIVQHNDDLGEPAEPTHPELPTLVRIETTARSEAAINEALQPLDLIMIDRDAWTTR
jgi:hypothetical protein